LPEDEEPVPPSEARRLLDAIAELPTDPLLGLLLSEVERTALEGELAAVEAERARLLGTTLANPRV
jgi:hypothetical protein